MKVPNKESPRQIGVCVQGLQSGTNQESELTPKQHKSSELSQDSTNDKSSMWMDQIQE
jgi:hypothetical protein